MLVDRRRVELRLDACHASMLTAIITSPKYWWTDRESNSDLDVANVPCYRYHYQPKIGGCNGIRTHIGDFTRPLTADSLPIRFHTPIEIGGSEGSRTLYLPACKAGAFATLEPLTHEKQDAFCYIQPRFPFRHAPRSVRGGRTRTGKGFRPAVPISFVR